MNVRMESLLKRLGAQRARLKSLYLYHGIFQLLLRLFLLAAVLFLLDFAVDPPRGMRIIMTLLAAGYLAFAAYRHLIYPLSRSLTAEDMALALERRFPELDGRVISAFQFHRSKDRILRYASKTLVEAAIEEGGEAASGLSFDALFDTRRIRKLGLACAAVFLFTAGYAFLHPDLTGIWARRMMGGNIDWPRRTTLRILLEGAGENFKLLTEPDPKGVQEVLMARGTSLPIRVQAEGRDPGEVNVVMEGDTTGRIIARATRRSDGEYWYRFRNVREDFRFRVEGGDDDGRGRHVDVQVLVLPEVMDVVCDYRYPEYLGLAEESRNSFQIEGPEGTEVLARFTLSAPVRDAVISVRTRDGETSFPLEVDENAPTSFRHRMTLLKSGTYRVCLTSKENFSNRDTALHSIIVQKDRAPRVKLYDPARAEIDVVPRGVVVFRAVAEDDYGVAEFRLGYKAAGKESFTVHHFTDEERDGPYGADRITAGYVLDFESFRLFSGDEERAVIPGDVLVYTLEAFDARPDREMGRADSGRYRINIVSENEKIRLLTERQIRLKEEIVSLKSLQTERLEKTKGVLEEIDAGGAGGEFDRLLVTLQIGQNQLTGRFRETSRELARIFDGYLFNRMDQTAAAQAMLDRAVRVRLDAPLSEAFDPDLYAPLVALFQTGELGEMDQLERLIVMLGLCLDLSESLSPEAAGLLAGGMVAPDASKVPGFVAECVEVQKRIIETLDALLEKMEEWGDYQELLQLFRDAIDRQYNVNIMMREELRRTR